MHNKDHGNSLPFMLHTQAIKSKGVTGLRLTRACVDKVRLPGGKEWMTYAQCGDNREYMSFLWLSQRKALSIRDLHHFLML